MEGWARDEHGQPYLEARVAAPPVDGAANAALEKMIAKALKHPASSVRVVAGERGRLKHLEIDGLVPSDLHRLLGEPD